MAATKKSATVAKKVTRRQQQFLRPYLTEEEVRALYDYLGADEELSDRLRGVQFELGRFL